MLLLSLLLNVVHNYMQCQRRKTIKKYQAKVLDGAQEDIHISELERIEMLSNQLDQEIDDNVLQDCLSKYMRYYDMHVSRIKLLKRHGGTRQDTFLP